MDITLIGLFVLLLLIGLFGVFYSFYRVKQHKGETDEIHGPYKHHRIALNPHFASYLIFTLSVALLVGIMTVLFS
ncbi:MAG TPA: hypothetical protein VF199_08675 [Bacillales bacterium]